ncbi:MAG: hypothetical protein BGO98_14745 [Myxococcales bacterium 68-20]|nr:hypothetical protein [Myxococcales bacterium]OJY31334.1 MAG: hypothetical protein BGO98_14745 [Myxococcales bacterium 68-20]
MVALLSNAANPFAQVTPHVPAEALAVAAGALIGVAIYGLALALLSRRKPRRRPAFQGAAADIASIASYAAVPAVRRYRDVAASHPPPRVFAAPAPYSNALAAGGFAKMGFAFGERVHAGPTSANEAADDSIPCELESMPLVSGGSSDETGPMAAVTVQPIIPIGDPSMPIGEAFGS